MPAVSKAQRRFFGYLRGNPAEAKKRGISMESVEHFASTKDAGLPERKHSNASKHIRNGYRRS